MPDKKKDGTDKNKEAGQHMSEEFVQDTMPDIMAEEESVEDTYNRLTRRFSELGIDAPMSFDPESDEISLHLPLGDEQTYRELQSIFDELGLPIPDYDDLPSPAFLEDDDYDDDGNDAPITLDLDDVGDETPGFEFMTLMTSALGEKEMLEYATDVVCSGLAELIMDDPLVLRSAEGEIRPEWDVDWYDEIDMGDGSQYREHVRYLLGRYPKDKLQALVETAVKRAILIMISAQPNMLHSLVGQMAATMVALIDEEDEDNPITHNPEDE